MRYTPVELRHVRLSRTLFGGYKRADADVLLTEVADSFEDVWRERGELADRLEEVERLLDEVKQRETLLASTLIAAERTAVEAVEAAKRQAEIIVAEAHQESRSITRAAQNERERLFAEARRVEVLLRAALGIVEETHSDQGSHDDDADPEPPAAWPNREHTAEFEAVSIENVTGSEVEASDDREAAGPPSAQDAEAEDDDVPSSGRDFVWG
jgi:cell division septum initiation protein DivIVA